MTISITLAQLKDMKPCSGEPIRRFGDAASMDARQAFAAGYSIRQVCWVAWKLGEKDKLAAFARKCADSVVHLENLSRPRAAAYHHYAAAADAAAAAAAAAASSYHHYAAAAASYAASYAAAAAAASYAAAADAADAAAAAAAWAAADAAAWAAADAAAWAEARQKHTKLCQGLFVEVFCGE